MLLFLREKLIGLSRAIEKIIGVHMACLRRKGEKMFLLVMIMWMMARRSSSTSTVGFCQEDNNGYGENENDK